MTPSTQMHHPNPTTLTCPEVVLAPRPEFDTVKLFINDLPQPDQDCPLNDPSSCVISRTVHQYKRLITEGDRLGEKTYRRKVDHNHRVQSKNSTCKDKTIIPLENPYFYANVSHFIRYDYTNSRLEINFVLCHLAAEHIQISNHPSYTLVSHEVFQFTTRFCTMCANELQIYLDAVYIDALRSHRSNPDFYGLLQSANSGL